MHLKSQRFGSLRRGQTTRNSTKIQPGMPLPHLAHGKVGTSYNIKLYKPMNMPAHLENIKKLAKNLRRRIPRKHN
jgi:hypothetical protein